MKKFQVTTLNGFFIGIDLDMLLGETCYLRVGLE